VQNATEVFAGKHVKMLNVK